METNAEQYIIQSPGGRTEDQVREALTSAGVSLDSSYRSRIGGLEEGALILRGRADPRAADRARAMGFALFPDVKVTSMKRIDFGSM